MQGLIRRIVECMLFGGGYILFCAFSCWSYPLTSSVPDREGYSIFRVSEKRCGLHHRAKVLLIVVSRYIPIST